MSVVYYEEMLPASMNYKEDFWDAKNDKHKYL
jgi:hypothetical protein